MSCPKDRSEAAIFSSNFGRRRVVVNSSTSAALVNRVTVASRADPSSRLGAQSKGDQTRPHWCRAPSASSGKLSASLSAHRLDLLCNLLRRHVRRVVHGAHSLHRLKKLLDPLRLQSLPQQTLDRLWRKQSGLGGIAGKLIGQCDLNRRHLVHLCGPQFAHAANSIPNSHRTLRLLRSRGRGPQGNGLSGSFGNSRRNLRRRGLPRLLVEPVRQIVVNLHHCDHAPHVPQAWNLQHSADHRGQQHPGG